MFLAPPVRQFQAQANGDCQGIIAAIGADGLLVAGQIFRMGEQVVGNDQAARTNGVLEEVPRILIKLLLGV